MIQRHHILFNKRGWTSYKEGETLRETPSLIIPMEREAHAELHRTVPIVPLLGYYGLSSVRSAFTPTGDSKRDIDALQMAMERTKRHPKAHELEKSLADLAIHAIDLQKPFFE